MEAKLPEKVDRPAPIRESQAALQRDCTDRQVAMCGAFPNSASYTNIENQTISMGCWTANLQLLERKLALVQPILPYEKGQATEAESNHKDWARHVHLKAISKPQAALHRG